MKRDRRKKWTDLQDEDSSETALTEIEFTPDGRIFLFGASREVLTLIRDCGLADAGVDSRIGPVAEFLSENTTS